MKGIFQKLLYGLVEVGVSAAEIFIRLHLLVFYSKNGGLSTFWVGVALSIPILWAAAIDPWIGRFSDDFKMKNGTRIHLVLIGAILTTFMLLALYHPPTLDSLKAKWVYLLITSLLYNTAFTFFSIPYSAMVGDYTSERNQRSQFIAWRLGFANVGALLGVGIPGFFLTHNESTAYGHASFALAMVIVSVTLLGSLAPPPKIEPTKAQPKVDPHPFRHASHNKPFLLLILAYFAVNVGLTFNSAAALFYYRIRLQLDEMQVQNLMLIFLLVFSASIPLWLLITKFLGRKRSLLMGALILGISNCVIYLWLPVGDATKAYIWAAGFGGLLVGCSVLLESLLTDVTAYDEVKSGQEKLGLYFGLWKFSAKFSRALALFLTGSLLDWANVAFPDIDTSHRLALIYGPGVGAFFILAALVMFPYRLGEKEMAKVKRILARRQQA